MTTPETTTQPPSFIRATWLGEHRFDAGRLNAPAARIDGSGQTGQSPPDALLSALATCSAIDVVDVLAKRRTPVTSMTVDVEGHRREQQPRRFEHIILTFRVDGQGIERSHAERAVHLAFEKYCTVAASLAPDIRIETEVVLNGERGERLSHPIFTP